MKAAIKRAMLKDIEELNKISLASKKHWNYPQEWIEKWQDDLILKEADFLSQNILKIEEINGSIIGFCSIQEHENEYEILHLWVKPEHIGKGYGKYLLQESIKLIVIRDKPILVEADPNAEYFYKSQGFITVDKKESYPKGRFLPVMKKINNH